MGKKVTVLTSAFLGILLAVWGILGGSALGGSKEQYIELAEYKGMKISRKSILVSDETIQNRLKAFPPECTDEEREEMERQLRASMERKNLMEQVWEQVREETLILKYPDDMTEECMNAYISYFDGLFRQFGGDMETFLTIQNLTQEEFKEKLTETVKNDVAELMIIEAIAKKENLKIGEKEYQEGLRELAADFGVDYGKLEAEKGKELVERTLLKNKVVTYLAGHAVVDD